MPGWYSALIARARSAASPGVHKIPLMPSSTASAIAPARDAMTGRPNWNATSAFWEAVADR